MNRCVECRKWSSQVETVIFIIAATITVIAIVTVTKAGPQPVLDRSLVLYQELEAEAAVDLQSLHSFWADSRRDYRNTR